MTQRGRGHNSRVRPHSRLIRYTHYQYMMAASMTVAMGVTTAFLLLRIGDLSFASRSPLLTLEEKALSRSLGEIHSSLVCSLLCTASIRSLHSKMSDMHHRIA
ncbi:hypothetical protein Tco_0589406 [Tanacetum coccineum]